jgi:hypothetical protein
MGEMTFLVPASLEAAGRRELERACLAGGPESTPWPTHAAINGERLILTREVSESGCLHAPWGTNGHGRVMTSTCTLMERQAPYRLAIELARGKLNQVRNQAWEWQAAGLNIPAEFTALLARAQQAFRTAVAAGPETVADLAAADALEALSQSSRRLVRAYVDQIQQIRRERGTLQRLPLGCRYESQPEAGSAATLISLSQTATLACSWRDIEPTQGTYIWDKLDELFAWGEKAGLELTGGAIIDCAGERLPEWLGPWLRDANQLARATCRFAQAVVRRYYPRVRRWILTRGSNCSDMLRITEQEMLWLNLRLAQAVRQMAPDAELGAVLSRPWGDYLAFEEHEHSPFVFADLLVRSDINLSSLGLELVMGLPRRESYARDLLDVSRLLDLFSLLGSPLHVILGYPSHLSAETSAEQGGAEAPQQNNVTEEAQADWAAAYTALAACKPYVQNVSWILAADGNAPHSLAGCGLCDAQGRAKPAVAELSNLQKRFTERA